MAIDEAKRVFQGGLQFIPVKHGSAKRIEYNSGIYVTCNEVRMRKKIFFFIMVFLYFLQVKQITRNFR